MQKRRGTKRRKEEWTTVSIKRETKEMIDEIGTYGDNFDDILKKLLKQIKR